MGIFSSKVEYEVIQTQRSSFEMKDMSSAQSHFPLNKRAFIGKVRNLIISGSILEAIEILEINTSEVIQPGSKPWISLHSLHYIELIKQNLTMDALKFAKTHLSSYKDSKILTKGGDVSMMELMGLLCYAAPTDSALGYLLEPSQREITAALISESLSESSSQKYCKLSEICKKLCRRNACN